MALSDLTVIEARVGWVRDSLALPDGRYDNVIRATLEQCPNVHWAVERMRAWLAMGVK